MGIRLSESQIFPQELTNCRLRDAQPQQYTRSIQAAPVNVSGRLRSGLMNNSALTLSVLFERNWNKEEECLAQRRAKMRWSWR